MKRISRRRWNKIKKASGFRCASCGIKDSPSDPLTRDHIYPRSKGGKNRVTNIQPLCYACNRHKGDSTDPGLPSRLTMWLHAAGWTWAQDNKWTPSKALYPPQSACFPLGEAVKGAIKFFLLRPVPQHTEGLRPSGDIQTLRS